MKRIKNIEEYTSPSLIKEGSIMVFLNNGRGALALPDQKTKLTNIILIFSLNESMPFLEARYFYFEGTWEKKENVRGNYHLESYGYPNFSQYDVYLLDDNEAEETRKEIFASHL
jgi:hypothetical protein